MLRDDYDQLQETLLVFEEVDEIETAVCRAGCFVALVLLSISVPVPDSILNHGPKSIVFNWSNEGDNLYLTISTDRISVLRSSPKQIESRYDLISDKIHT